MGGLYKVDDMHSELYNKINLADIKIRVAQNLSLQVARTTRKETKFSNIPYQFLTY